MTGPSNKKIDPRGPRVGAGITSVVLAAVIVLGLGEAPEAGAIGASWWLLFYAWVMFAWGVIAGVQGHPYGLLFRRVIRPRLRAPQYLEPTSPPRFAQGVGLLVASVGLVLHLAHVPYGLVAAAAAAFVAAFLNAVFGLCLGCELYGLILRWRRLGKKRTSSLESAE